MTVGGIVCLFGLIKPVFSCHHNSKYSGIQNNLKYQEASTNLTRVDKTITASWGCSVNFRSVNFHSVL